MATQNKMCMAISSSKSFNFAKNFARGLVNALVAYDWVTEALNALFG